VNISQALSLRLAIPSQLQKAACRQLKATPLPFHEEFINENKAKL
jgi:hypothetical protein